MPLVLDGTNGVSGVDGTASNPAIEGTDSNTGIFYPAADTVAIATGGTEALRVNSSQNVGIGTSSPAVKLDVAGNATIQNGVLTVGKDTLYDAFINTPESMYFNVDSDGNSTNNKFVWGTDRASNTGGTTWMTLFSSGCLGVGSLSDNGAGTIVAGGSGTSHYVASTKTGVTQTYLITDASGGNIQVDGAWPIRFTTNSTERARFTSGGHFCVGTTTVANTAFQATFYESSNGGIILQNGTNYSAVSCSSNDVYIDVGRGGTAGSFNVRTSSNNDVRLQISSTGVMTCLGVYNNTVGATNRDVFVDNTGKVGYVASIRASKTNIQNLTDTSWLHQLNPVSFNYRKKDEEGSYTDETDGDIQYGMIAEDVEQVRPDLCFYDDVDGEQELRGIQYSKLVPVMLKEIQKLRAELDALKGAA